MKGAETRPSLLHWSLILKRHKPHNVAELITCNFTCLFSLSYFYVLFTYTRNCQFFLRYIYLRSVVCFTCSILKYAEISKH